nr:hypothetical protein CFP56_58937 [Quercus suber]
MERKGGHIEYQYGDFLRATGGHPRDPGTKAASSSSVSEEGTGYEAEKSGVQAKQGGSLGKMEKHVFNPGNPSVTDKGIVEIQGEGKEILHIDSSDINCHANLMAIKTALVETGPKIQHSKQLDTDFSKVEET